MSTGKPNKRPRSDFANVTTLLGMSQQDQIDFSWNDLRRFFKVVLWDRSRNCASCKEPMTFEEASLDHIVPRSKGGRTRLANLQLMHSGCNVKKNDTMPDNFSRHARTPVNSRKSAITNYMLRSGRNQAAL